MPIKWYWNDGQKCNPTPSIIQQLKYSRNTKSIDTKVPMWVCEDKKQGKVKSLKPLSF